jgi:hypothetical protein
MTYTHEVRFTKTFTNGALKGIRIENVAIRFCDVTSAHAFIRKALAKPSTKACAGGDYRISDPYLYSL